MPILLDNELYLWGWGKYGQLGNGNELDHHRPFMLDRTVTQGQTVKDVACGFMFTIIVCRNGSVFSWGYGKNGQLGHDGQLKHAKIPRKIKYFNNKKIQFVAAGREHSVALSTMGELYTWGSGTYGVLGQGNHLSLSEPKLVTKFSPMLEAKTSSEEVDGTGESESDSIKVKCTSVSCGSYHTIVRDDLGKVYTWGLGKSGRLGHDDEENRLIPTIVKHLECEDAVQVDCGWSYSVALLANGDVYTWGCGRDFQLGAMPLGNAGLILTPSRLITWLKKGTQKLKKNPVIQQISCGAKHSLAVDEEGKVFSWGRGEFGRLGHGNERHSLFPTEIEYLNGKGIIQVSAGSYHSMALSSSGIVYVWGCGEYGRLGTHDTSDVSTPVPLTMFKGKCSKVQAGAYVSVALSEKAADEKGFLNLPDKCSIL